MLTPRGGARTGASTAQDGQAEREHAQRAADRDADRAPAVGGVGRVRSRPVLEILMLQFDLPVEVAQDIPIQSRSVDRGALDRLEPEPSPPDMTLYERLGGEPAFTVAVDDFYRRMLGDPRVARFFDDVDMEGQIAKQKAFLTYVTGGPAEYSGQDMRTAHADLVQRGLADEHVDVVIEHLGATLTSLGAAPEDVAEVAGLAESVRADVLGR